MKDAPWRLGSCLAQSFWFPQTGCSQTATRLPSCAFALPTWRPVWARCRPPSSPRTATPRPVLPGRGMGGELSGEGYVLGSRKKWSHEDGLFVFFPSKLKGSLREVVLMRWVMLSFEASQVYQETFLLKNLCPKKRPSIPLPRCLVCKGFQNQCNHPWQ